MKNNKKRYYIDVDKDSALAKWLDKQENKRKSIELAAFDAEKKYGKGDIINNALFGRGNPITLPVTEDYRSVSLNNKKKRPIQLKKPEEPAGLGRLTLL